MGGDADFEEIAFRVAVTVQQVVEGGGHVRARRGHEDEYADTAGNLRLYYPDFVALGEDGTHWLLETKGQEDTNVPLKDLAATLWCKNASELVGRWRYQKVPQTAFERVQPDTLDDLRLLAQTPLT